MKMLIISRFKQKCTIEHFVSVIMLQLLCALTAKLLDREEANKKQHSFIVTEHTVVEFLYSWKVDFSIGNNIWGLSTNTKSLMLCKSPVI